MLVGYFPFAFLAITLTACGTKPGGQGSDLGAQSKDGVVLPEAYPIDEGTYEELLNHRPLGTFVVTAPRGLFFRNPGSPETTLPFPSEDESQGARGLLGFGSFVVGVGYIQSGSQWMLAYRAGDDGEPKTIGLVYGRWLQPVDKTDEGGTIPGQQGGRIAVDIDPKRLVFPISFIPSDFGPGSERQTHFAAPRNGNQRAHAACDLLGPVASPVYALADGIVEDYRPFYSGTDAIVVRHRQFVARYGEIKGFAPGVKVGSRVRAGQVIAYIGRLYSGNSMLHLELFDSQATGGLTRQGVGFYPLLKTAHQRKNFARNQYLIDGTNLLIESLASNRPRGVL